MKVTVFLMGHFLTCAHFTFAVEPPVMLNCYCKLGLHGRCSFAALLGSIKKHGLHLVKFNDYYSFFKYLTGDCPKDNYAHISWQYTPDKTTLSRNTQPLEKFCRQPFTLS